MNISAQLSEALTGEAARTMAEFGEAAAALGSRLYAVGGVVRDAILGHQVSEVDLVIVGDVDRFAAELQRAGAATRTARSQFLTVKLSSAGGMFDVARARRETYPTPGALPEVEPADLEADLARRDFSANAMAVPVTPGETFGTLIDPHDGRADIERGVIRALHAASFRDDATRIFRAARYAGRLGWELEADTERWVRRSLDHLSAIGGDRLRNEFNRCWAEARPAAALRLLDDWGALRSVHSGLRWDGRVAAVFAEAESIRPPDIDTAATCWAVLALFVVDGGAAESLVARLNLAPHEGRAFRAGAAWPGAVGQRFRTAAVGGMTPSEIQAALDPVDPAGIVAAGAAESGPAGEALKAYLERYRTVRSTLRGQDLLQMGIPEGPMIGDVLRRLRGALLDGEVSSESDERAFVRRWMDASGPG